MLEAHRRAEEKLAAANRELRRRIAEGQRLESRAPIGMALADMEGCWQQVNDALCRITGHTRAALKATTLRP